MPPKAAWINILVVDASTGKELRTAVVTLRRVKNPKLFALMSATVHRIAIPADANISVEITAPQYQSHSPFIMRLRPEEEREMKIPLEP
jgi:hypothetical protein